MNLDVNKEKNTCIDEHASLEQHLVTDIAFCHLGDMP